LYPDRRDIFLKQSRRAVVQSGRAKIERVIICQSHRIKAGTAEQLR
jgi:hypothetical protein